MTYEALGVLEYLVDEVVQRRTRLGRAGLRVCGEHLADEQAELLTLNAEPTFLPMVDIVNDVDELAV